MSGKSPAYCHRRKNFKKPAPGNRSRVFSFVVERTMASRLGVLSITIVRKRFDMSGKSPVPCHRRKKLKPTAGKSAAGFLVLPSSRQQLSVILNRAATRQFRKFSAPLVCSARGRNYDCQKKI
jgi:hypothetical protein